MCHSKQSFLTFECLKLQSMVQCFVTKLLKEAPFLSGFLAVTSCLPSPSLNPTNQWDSLTHPFNQWAVAGGGAWFGWERPLRFFCGCCVDCGWVYGAGKPSAHQRSSATNLCLHVCSTLWSIWNDRLQPFCLTSTAVHDLTSDVCVCKWKSDDSFPLPDKEMHVMWGGGRLPVTTATF